MMITSFLSNQLANQLEKFSAVIPDQDYLFISVSGGLDSMLLWWLCAYFAPDRVIGVHIHSQIVFPEATRRVLKAAVRYGMDLHIERRDALKDSHWQANPDDRCYYCKSKNIVVIKSYIEKYIKDIMITAQEKYWIGSGTNLDDLQEYRPGLIAENKEEKMFRPYLELGWGKKEIRFLAKALDLPFAALLPDSCLATRIYSGTKVTQDLLTIISQSEEFLRDQWGVNRIRCRIKETVREHWIMEIEVEEKELHLTRAVDLFVLQEKWKHFPIKINLEVSAYRAGRALLSSR